MRKILVIFLLFLFYNCDKKDIPIKISLHENWQFKAIDTLNWKTATVPRNVFTDLLTHQIIEDPFIKNNEEKVQWVSNKNWEYKTDFYLSKKILEKKNIELNFEGLDTYTSIYLNDSLLGQTNNAFRKFSFDIKRLAEKENNLKIIFANTNEIETKLEEKKPYKLPVEKRVYTRKAQFQYGWDWGSISNTSGIWKDVSLNAWNDYKIEDFLIKQLSVNKKEANLLFEIKKLSNIELDKEISYEIYINEKLVEKSNEIYKGYSWIKKIKIHNPKLWWTHNLGQPYLYNIKVIVKKHNIILDSISSKYGIRTIKLINKKDSIGESFYFELNGKSVYMKGANYIPQNSFQNKVTHQQYEKLLSDVVNSNMNMLRVWGGGIYENDIFYDLCDEKGILVWQDFMFACAMYPEDTDFLANIKEEAEQQVKRLRNHASIALWCGNNENSEGWKRWGWRENRGKKEIQDIWNDYLAVFNDLLPKVVAENSETDYWETSPKYGRGNPNYELEGDAHDWWIWHDEYPFEHLENHPTRFMSEFGFQSYPSFEAINYINQKDTIDIQTDAIKSHQKHERGFQLIEDYMARDYTIPTNDDDYVYISQ